MYLLKKRRLVWQLLNELDPRVYRAYQLISLLRILWFFPAVGTHAETLSFRINFAHFVMDKIIVTKGGWQMKGD